MRIFSLAGASPVQTIEAARMVHRRVVSPMNGGPDCIDLGLNTYAAGGEVEGPYAYNRDEFCYISEGETETNSSGVRVRSTSGTFMWRPAGVSTNWLRGIKDVVNICAFAPARMDTTSHRLPASQIPSADDQPGSAPLPRRVHLSMVPLSTFPGVAEQAGLVYRKVFSRDNGCPVMDVDHTLIASRTSFSLPSANGEELWWLESGELQIEASGEIMRLTRHECLVRASGESIDRVWAPNDSVLIRFCLPAGKPESGGCARVNT